MDADGGDDDENDGMGDRNGFFKSYHLQVLQRLRDADLQRLSACPDDAHRLTVCYGLACVHQHAEFGARFRSKSASRAKSARLEGNQAFQMSHYRRALACYSLALREAPLFCGNNRQPVFDS